MKRIGSILALICCQVLYADTHVFHVFPVVVEFKNVRGIEAQWHLLLGRNAEKDISFKVGIYQEFGGTQIINSQKLDPRVIEGYTLEYLANQTKQIYTEGDLSSLLDRKPNVDDPHFYMQPNVKDKQGVIHHTVFVFLDVRKSLARLNTDGRNEYKTEFRWMLISDLLALNTNQVNSMSIDFNILNYRQALDDCKGVFMDRLCNKRGK